MSIRRTPTMKFIQSKYGGKDIRDIIILELENAQGESKAAAKAMGISESAISRYIIQLQIIDAVNNVRHRFDRIALETDMIDPSSRKLLGIYNPLCTSCGVEFKTLIGSVIEEVGKDDNNGVLQIKDKDDVRHFFTTLQKDAAVA